MRVAGRRDEWRESGRTQRTRDPLLRPFSSARTAMGNLASRCWKIRA
jgi:hypothetical protein